MLGGAVLQRIALPVGVVVAATSLFALAPSALAATYTWDGGGTNALCGGVGTANNWNCGQNWSTNIVPGVNDIALFNSTSIKNSNITGAVNVKGIDVATGYTGTINQGANVTVGSSNVEFESGTFVASGHTFTANGTVTVSGGTYTGGTGTFNIAGDLLITSGTFTAPNSLILQAGFEVNGTGSFVHGTGTVTATMLSETWAFDDNVEEFYNLTISKTDDAYIYIEQDDVLTINNTLTLTDGKAGSVGNWGYFDVKGNVSQANTFDGGSAFIRFAANSTVQTYTIAGGEAIGVIFDNTSDASDSVVINGITTLPAINVTSLFGNNPIPVTNSGNYALTVHSWLQEAGSYDASAQSSWKLEQLSVTGGTFVAPDAIEAFGYDASWVLPGGEITVENFEMDKVGGEVLTLATGDVIQVNADVILRQGLIDNPFAAIQVAGDATVESTYNGGSAQLMFVGTGNSIFNLAGAEDRYDGGLNVFKSLSGRVTLASDLVMDATNQFLWVDNGVFATNGNDLTMNNSSSIYDITIDSGAVLEIWGTETFTLSSNDLELNSNSTVRYKGTPNGVANYLTLNPFLVSFGHLQIDTTNTGPTRDLFTLGGNLDINGNLTLTNGNLYVSTSNYSLNIGGNFSQVSGDASFTEGYGTVTLDGGNQIISGGLSFYNLNKTVTSAATLTFTTLAAPANYEVNGLLSLNGAAGQLLSIRSSVAGTAAKINIQGTQSLSYLDVKDSDASPGIGAVCAATTCVNSGNNTNWTF